MYILIESSGPAITNADIYDIDTMGYTDSEETAMEWRDANPQYRAYKYMPDKKITL